MVLNHRHNELYTGKLPTGLLHPMCIYGTHVTTLEAPASE